VTTRVGVVADTHCPEFSARLPDGIARLFDGVSLIIHAGDVDGQGTLTDLARIAPVEAVRGDHDRELVALPTSRELEIEGKRIVITHGNRSRWIEESQTFFWTLSLGHYQPHKGLARELWRRYPGADVIVYGHTHRPHIESIEGTLIFNPGGVHQWNPTTAARRLQERPGWFEWCWLQVARHMRRFLAPTVGLLEIDHSGVVPKVLSL